MIGAIKQTNENTGVVSWFLTDDEASLFDSEECVISDTVTERINDVNKDERALIREELVGHIAYQFPDAPEGCSYVVMDYQDRFTGNTSLLHISDIPYLEDNNMSAAKVIDIIKNSVEDMYIPWDHALMSDEVFLTNIYYQKTIYKWLHGSNHFRCSYNPKKAKRRLSSEKSYRNRKMKGGKIPAYVVHNIGHSMARAAQSYFNGIFSGVNTYHVKVNLVFTKVDQAIAWLPKQAEQLEKSKLAKYYRAESDFFNYVSEAYPYAKSMQNSPKEDNAIFGKWILKEYPIAKRASARAARIRAKELKAQQAAAKTNAT